LKRRGRLVAALAERGYAVSQRVYKARFDGSVLPDGLGDAAIQESWGARFSPGSLRLRSR